MALVNLIISVIRTLLSQPEYFRALLMPCDNTDTSRFNVITHPRQKIYCFAHIPLASSWLSCQVPQQLMRQLLLIQKTTVPRLCEATNKSAYPRSATHLLPESKSQDPVNCVFRKLSVAGLLGHLPREHKSIQRWIEDIFERTFRPKRYSLLRRPMQATQTKTRIQHEMI